MPRHGLLAFTLLLVAACGGDTTEPISTWAELCGEAAPRRILPLDPERPPSSSIDWRVGDRRLLELAFSPDPGLEGPRELWIVDDCGDNPLLLSDRIQQLLQFTPKWTSPDISRFPAMGCSVDTHDLLVLDPTGARPSVPVFASRGCNVRATDQGIVGVLGSDAELGPLVLQRWPGDPWADAVESVELLPEVLADSELLAHAQGQVFALDPNRSLLAVDLETLAVTTLATEVRSFAVGSSPRWVLWQGMEITADDPSSQPLGPLQLLDREAGESTLLGQGYLATSNAGLNFRLEQLGVLYVLVGGWWGEHRYYSLDTLEYIEIPDKEPIHAIDDHRALLDNQAHYVEPLVVVDFETGDHVLVDPGTSLRRWDLDGVLLYDDDIGPLVRVDWSGARRALAERASGQFRVLPDESVVTPLPSASGEGLSLVHARGAQQAILEQQLDLMLWANPRAGDRQVTWIPADDDPDRFGVWLGELGE